ncbi:hypothetical protein GQ600_18247 [Phytophthora cactorum]|nr:hypothetical protein GQ600_18247 [Phytophthora cactorum]
MSIKKPRLNNDPSNSGTRAAARPTTERPEVPPTQCPHCSELNWLSECPTATADQNSDIRRRLADFPIVSSTSPQTPQTEAQCLIDFKEAKQLFTSVQAAMKLIWATIAVAVLLLCAKGEV